MLPGMDKDQTKKPKKSRGGRPSLYKPQFAEQAKRICEVFGAIVCGRKGMGIELKESYFEQAAANLLTAKEYKHEQDLIK